MLMFLRNKAQDSGPVGPLKRSSSIGLSAVVSCTLMVCLALLFGGKVSASSVARKVIEPGIYACLKNARVASLECHPPGGDAAKGCLGKYLANPADWTRYKDRMAVAIPFAQLSPSGQRTMLLALFPEDEITEEGWWHTVQFTGAQGMETVWTLCEWLTGKGTDYKVVAAEPRNTFSGTGLTLGQRILVPAALLRPAMRALPAPIEVASSLEEMMLEELLQSNGAHLAEPELDLDALSRELVYGTDKEGPFARYILKQGEALYTAVVVRFTDFVENDAILKAADVIAKRSGIKDVRHIKPGQKVLIPVHMLSDRYHPEGSERRVQFEAVLREADRLKRDKVSSRDLDGVVIVLDAGHGGGDPGACDKNAKRGRAGLIEDELNYDIACRIKRIVESRTRARIHMTVLDPNQRYTPTAAKIFKHDKDEELLTSPRYKNTNAKVSANLRWYLANSIYRKERARGIDPRKIVFTSIHTEAHFNARLRGTMIYIPGAKNRRDHEEHHGNPYDKYKEVREQRVARSTASERRRDEALSRNFAQDLLDALGRHNPPIMRHKASDPIRSQIRRKGGSFVPAVLRNTLIPTKVLVETANMTNPTDCKRLADPEWREWFAEAYVDALIRFYKS